MYYITNTKPLFHRSVCSPWKNLGQNPPFLSNQIVIILKKGVVRQAVGGVEENIKIPTIFNKYKDIFNDLIESSDEESQDWRGPINKGSYRAPRFEGNLRGLLEKEDSLDQLSRLMPKTGKSQVYQPHDVVPLSPKSGKQQYKKS